MDNLRLFDIIYTVNLRERTGALQQVRNSSKRTTMNEITNNEVTTSTTDFHTGIIAVSKTQKVANKNQRVFQAYVKFGFPVLDQVGAFPSPDSYETVEVKGGPESASYQSPVYEDAKLSYLQSALFGAVVANARNKSSQDINVELPMDWDSLFAQASAERFGTVMRQYMDTLTEWLAEHSGYTQEQGAQILSLMSVQKIGGMDAATKGALLVVQANFKEALEDYSEIAMAVKAIDGALAKDSANLGFITAAD